MTTNSRPSRIIKIDKHTNKIALPTILLQTRNFNTIGKIGYSNLNFSFVANGIDEISFNVHKYVDGKKCPIWDDIIDLKIIEVEDYGRFEISVNYTDNTETTKVICGQSLEVELGQIGLYEFHVNDEDDVLSEKYKPTVFWNDNDKEYSLLHRVLADKAPHWSWGYVTPCITLEENGKSELSSTFQRTYTANGETIYDFLTGTVAEESNVIFVFDTFRRQISCYSLYDCVNPQTGEVVQGIGEDTNVLVSKKKLANEISISSNKDSVKNCFRIEGGDDIITDMVRAVSMTGSNYINVFSEFQLNDMSEELRKKLVEYQAKISDQGLQEQYYGENGIYTRLCKAYEDLSYYESSMMPNVEIKETTAEEQYNLVKQKLINNHVGINSFSSYTSTGFTGVTGNVEEMANVYVDARYRVTVEAVSYTHTANTSTGKWTGKIKVTHTGDETNFYPKTDEQNVAFSVIIEDNKTDLLYTKQKIEIALSDGNMFDIDFDVANMNEAQMRNYFSQYSLNRLKSFAEGYNNCLSVLMKVGETTTSETQSTLYDKYALRYRVITNPPTSDNPNPTLGILEIRQAQVDDINDTILDLIDLQESFQLDNELNLETFLGEDYLEFCKYRREDTYSNSNYISDGKSTAECLQIAKELIDVATKEAKKACMLQRTVSTSLNNLFALPEFEPLYDKFALFNYIRVRTEDELLKLRLIGIEFNGDSIEEINVTFSDQIESIDGSLSDAQSIYQQMASVATSFPSTARQAKQGESAKNEIMDMYVNGLNAAKTMLSNNDNNEVTITNSGLIAKRMDDAGCYGNKQLRITGNGMYMTEDAWQTVSMAVGEIEFNGEQKYGVIAEVICGNLIAGSKMAIGNEKGTVEITGDGIKITNGTITWGDDGVNAPEIKDISNLTESLNEVDLYLEQLDGRIQTFSQTTDPSTSWTTTDEKNKHIDDLWVNPNNGLTKQWTGTTWKLVTDENLKNLASSKAQIFTSQPTTPYYAGDLWVQGSTGDIMHCKTTKTSGTFDSTHWVISSKYTNNDKLYEFIDGDFADAMLDIGTKIDGKADTFYQSNSPHQEYTNITDNATYNLWVGDMWYDTDTGQTFMYQKENLGNNKYDYKWKFMDIPDEVFDIIDTKKTIYTTLPANYNKDDMYILEVDRGSWEKGTILNALTTVKEQTTATFVPSHWKENVRYTDDSYVQNWIENDFKQTINDVKGQVDQRAQTWYMTDSEMKAEVATWTDKSIHVGDLWYKTDADKNGKYHTYIYNSSYQWEEINGVPTDVFDMADGSCSLFVSKPTNYRKNDMWILDIENKSGTNSTYPKYAKGTLLVAKNDNTSYSVSDWKENVRYTDDSYVKKWINEEYQENLTQINRQIDQRAQTWYKTKSEMDAEVATWTDKSIHEGDLWYRTDVSEGEDQTFVYTSSYTWEVMNGVPKDIFDMADGKCSLYVTKPTKGYKKNDMWILEVENENGSNSTYPKYKKGTLLVSNYDNDDYSFTDWEEKVNYSAELEKFVSDYNDELTKIQNQVDGKARAWYQSDDPVNNEEWDTTENHEGDLWYDTDSTSQITYIYKNGWQPMSVPRTVFDQIDGKNAIYTTLPLPTGSTAQDGDLLIPTSDVSYSGITYKAKKVYKYIGGYWIEIDYTDKTYVNDELNKAKDDIKDYSDGELEKFNKLVAKYLGFDGSTTLIDANYIISPKIYGGYAYFTKGNYSIEIDPNHGAGSNTLNNYLFCIRNKTNNSVIMGVDTYGKGYFSGGGKFTGTISIDGTNGVGAIDITGNGTTDRLLIHGASTIDRYENTYSRVDYQKFYVGNNSSVSHAGDGIIISTYDVFADYPHIRGWANGGTVSQAYLYAKSGFEIDSRGFMKIWTNEDEHGRNGHGVMINPDGSTFTSISATSYSFVNNSNNLITGSNSILGMVLNTDTSNGNKYIHIATSSGAYGVNVWASDTKLKKNIMPTIQTALDKINNLDFIQFDWKDGGSHVDLGLSANQVEEIIPDAIFDVVQDDSSEFDTLKNIDTTTMTVYALKAIKELSDIVEAQQQQIKELKGEK